MQFSVYSVTLLNEAQLWGLTPLASRLQKLCSETELPFVLYTAVARGHTEPREAIMDFRRFLDILGTDLMVGLAMTPENEADRHFVQRACPHGRLANMSILSWMMYADIHCKPHRSREDRILGNQLWHTLHAMGFGPVMKQYSQESTSPTEPFTLVKDKP